MKCIGNCKICKEVTCPNNQNYYLKFGRARDKNDKNNKNVI